MEGDKMAAEDLAARLDGLLSFPITPMTADGDIDGIRFRRHIDDQLDTEPAAIFPCCGTGEFFSLTLAEYEELIGAAVEEAAGRVPVIAGTGYGTRQAIEFAMVAERAGADGLLVLPPYLVQAPQAGLVAHYEQLARSTRLALILYQRANAVLSPATLSRLAETLNIIGLKDGCGDLEHLTRQRLATGDAMLFFNGMPTAEMSAPAFASVGACSYSSAALNFVPEIATSFYEAFRLNQRERVETLLDGFYRPLVDLRDTVPGYAVALVKAGLKVRGMAAGDTRPPLMAPSAQHEAQLRRIIEDGLSLVESGAGPTTAC